MTAFFKIVNEHADDIQAMKARREAASATLARKRARRRATRQFLIRAVIALFVVAGVLVAEYFGHISWKLAIPFECSAFVWFAVWLGAWYQFMFAEEGLLE